MSIPTEGAKRCDDAEAGGHHVPMYCSAHDQRHAEDEAAVGMFPKATQASEAVLVPVRIRPHTSRIGPSATKDDGAHNPGLVGCGQADGFPATVAQ